MKYKIDWLENKTSSTGKTYQKVSITSEEGQEIKDVSVWDMPFGGVELAPGVTVDAELIVKGNFTNLKPINQPQSRGGGNPAIKQAMQAKTESIQKFQDAKSDNIRLSATFRDATLLTVSFFNTKPGTVEEMRAKWLDFRIWLDRQYDKSPSAEESQPF